MERSSTYKEDKVYSIFGAGPSGLYTAWRLASGCKVRQSEADEKEYLLNEGDTIDMYDWAKYCFYDMDTKEEVVKGERVPGGRISTYYHKQNKHDDQPKPEAKDYLDNPFIEVGGMRYMKWNDTMKSGHRLVSHMIDKLGVGHADFNTISTPLMYIDGKRYYDDPENRTGCENEWNKAYDSLFDKYLGGFVHKEDSKNGGDRTAFKRSMRGDFYKHAAYKNDEGVGSEAIFDNGQELNDIGFWNFLAADPKIGPKGYQYLLKAGGYDSNLINCNTAAALVQNGEFVPGGVEYQSIEGGYSTLFSRLYMEIVKICKDRGIKFKIHGGRKLTSIYLVRKPGKFNDYKIGFSIGNDKQNFQSIYDDLETDYAFMCMPRNSIELIAKTTSEEPLFSEGGKRVHLFNHNSIIRNIGAVIKQPSYKVGAFFKEEWYMKDSLKWKPPIDKTTPGPTITDLPLRQIYYFGNNGIDQETNKAYGMLLSYDDMQSQTFWSVMRSDDDALWAYDSDIQPIKPPQNIKRIKDQNMLNMLVTQLAEVHDCDFDDIGIPEEAFVMDYGINPFGAGYHVWATHCNIYNAQVGIRKPTSFIKDVDAPLFIAGSAYSDDQGWVEGAFCTAESVLNEFFDAAPPDDISLADYNLICKENKHNTSIIS